ncbi:sigma-54-dependent Fis family transcriptional regulator [Dokdonella sp.]|uniref:sigma-54-dependent Fis family transcriptional regulator n=1 Tax=Dokdonella sp. TaxID=2291710 RepID=UPI001B0975E4|nr:sigma-54-dependent Fis family transcriptional regulator [Dokdonella sp.]MBO9661801.1 sigma-54-dependent Fis family transcriptional regulator [Dokdonella sp.]
MSESGLVVRHASRVIEAVRGELRNSLAPHVAKSWDRCLTEYGMQPGDARATAVLEATQLRERQQRMGELLGVARAEMESLYEQISGSGYAVILADADATILHTITDPTLKREFRHAGLWLGALWDERHEGTNGLGTAIAEHAPVTVHRDEHFMGYNVNLSCSGAPILDAHGGLLGVLDASSANCSDTRLIQRHTMALVTMSANLISRFHFLHEFPDAYILRFHSRPEFVGLLHEALIAVARDGTILAVNESAMAQLGHPDRSRLVGRSIESLFQFAFSSLQQRAATDPRTIWPIREVEHGRRFFALVRSREQSIARAPAGGAARAQPVSSAVEGGRRHVIGDPSMLHSLNCAQQLFGKRVPILLQGATGTGKEAFARALHTSCAWAGKPFVAVNCGAIPESLIESELFGYTRGAFTDADRHGRPGKILQSSGGTLFLDEIGDMPLTLQTRLLRVIEEFEIVPLGGDQAITVDLHVISASHRDIRQMVQDGDFREDLYYRLAGTTLQLPLLRDREDRAELIENLLREESDEATPVRIQPDALHALLSYHWPGNIRQLRNVLRTAAALCQDGTIRISNLPQELLDAAAKGAPPAAARELPIALTPSAAESCCRTPLDIAEHSALLRELERNRWNITHTADALGVSRNTLYRKIRKHRIPLAE